MNKEKPHIPEWKMWLLIFTTIQSLVAIQNYQVHQQIWKAFHHLQGIQNQVLQSEVEYHRNMNYSLERIYQKLHD